jgi:hypothetical protein
MNAFVMKTVYEGLAMLRNPLISMMTENSRDEERRTTATASRNGEEKSVDDIVLSNNDANDEAKSTLTLLNTAQVKEEQARIMDECK